MQISEKSTLIVGSSRTAIGSFGRSLKSVTPDKLATHVMSFALKNAGLAGGKLDEIIFGQAFQSPFRPNITRLSALAAGIPATTPAMTVQRQCGSGMETVRLAMLSIASGQSDLVLAGGVESMSQVDYVLPGSHRWKGLMAERFPKIVKLGPLPVIAGKAENGLAPTPLIFDVKTVNMSATAQRLADEYGISRQESDEFALLSQTRAQEAIKSGRLALEIDAFDNGRGFFAIDEHPRQTSLEALANLKPVLKSRSITAGNASGINDGACALVLASGRSVAELGLKPQALIVDSVVVGLSPEVMGLGPVYAIRKLLERNRLAISDIGAFEINEAFAAQYIACERMLGLDRTMVNANGGAIALGHPIAMSGARLIQTLALQMELTNIEFGIAALCIGGGMGIATLLWNPRFA